jgi:hypothetical protein
MKKGRIKTKGPETDKCRKYEIKLKKLKKCR